MKFLHTLLLLFVFLGCADKDAFSKFYLYKEQELAFDNLQRTKIAKNNHLFGIAGGLYLNNITPKQEHNHEIFYIQVVLKQPNLHDNIEFTLNSCEALSQEVLPKENDFAQLINSQNSWSVGYLVSFQKTSKQKLSLRLKLKNGATASVDFEKIQ